MGVFAAVVAAREVGASQTRKEGYIEPEHLVFLLHCCGLHGEHQSKVSELLTGKAVKAGASVFGVNCTKGRIR